MENASFILASASPRRKWLLEQAGFTFDVIPSEAVEPDPRLFPSVECFVIHTAHLKGLAVARRPDADSRWVLAADTVAALDGEVLGKPVDRADARRILQRLQGSRHLTWTGVSLLLPVEDVALTTAVSTVVHMRSLTAVDLEHYLDSGAWEGKAGGYGIQDRADSFVSLIEGSFSNVVGLPLERLRTLFMQAESIQRGSAAGRIGSDKFEERPEDVNFTPA